MTAGLRPRFWRIGLAAVLAAGPLVAHQPMASAVPTAPAATAGWNDWTCQPSAEHPRPVVLLHGLGGSSNGWQAMADQLALQGWCVFAPTYGQSGLLRIGGTAPAAESALEVSGFIDEVQAATGAAKVDLVGHSLGGFLSLYIPKILGRAGDVGHVVTIGTDPHSSGPIGPTDLVDLLGLRPLPEWLAGLLRCQACTDVLPDSAPRRQLAEGPITQPGISYTLIHTRYDEFAVVLDPTSAPSLDEPGAHSLYVQDVCPINTVGHLLMPSDPTVIGIVANALDPANVTPPPCAPALPV